MTTPTSSIFDWTKQQFHLPLGMIYLDGNSLGPLPKATPGRIETMLTEEWGAHLITGWNACNWMEMPTRLGDRIGRLIGAETGHTVVGDTLGWKHVILPDGQRGYIYKKWLDPVVE